MDRTDIISFCLTLKNTYQDAPFRDEHQLVISHRENRKVFVWFFEAGQNEYVRFRCKKEEGEHLIRSFPQFQKGFSYKEVCWLEVPLYKVPPEDILKEIITESFELTRPEKRKKPTSWYFT